MPQPAPRVTLIQDASRPLVLVGPPRDVRGELTLQNASDEKVIVRQPVMRLGSAAARRGKHARAAQPRQSMLTLRRMIVRARQARQVPIALALDSTTPPGTYEAELDVDGELRHVVVHVIEDLSFSMAPAALIIPNRPGERIPKRVVFTNTGNVAISVKPVGPVVLDEELVHCRALRGALADVGATLKNLDDFIVALGHRYHDLYEARVLKVQNEKTTIEPGDTKAVDLTITLPDKLDSRARYTGLAPVSTQSLTFTVVPE
jgi:hypothetical protein